MPAAQRRAGLPWQRAPPSTRAEEPDFLAGHFGVRFGALALQTAPSRRAERSVQTEDTPSGIFLYRAASSCLTALPLTPFTFPSSTVFLLCVWHSLFCPDALRTYRALLAFGPFCCCSRFSPVQHVHPIAIFPPQRETAGARLVRSYICADELACQLGGTYFRTSLPGVAYIWVCQPFSCQTGQIRVAVTC